MQRWIAGLLIATLAGAGLAACGGDDDSASPTDPAADGAGDPQPADGPGTSAAPDTDDGSLRDLLERQGDAVVKVTYERGDERLTIAQDGDRRSVRTGDSLIITDADRTVSCDDLGGEPSCSEVPAGFADIADLGLGLFDLIADALLRAGDALDEIDTTTSEIAGRGATCVEYDAADIVEGFAGGFAEQFGDLAEGIEGSARICVDDETGVLLEVRIGDGDGTESFVATDVGEPTDADFEPPAPVEAAPDLGDLSGDLDLGQLFEDQQDQPGSGS